VKAAIEFEWWQVNPDSESGMDAVKHEHREALTETAVNTIQHYAVMGYVEGELSDSIHMAGDDSEEGTIYRGYWKLVGEKR
jgi:hypothetical protein